MLAGQPVRVEVDGFSNDMVTIRDRNDALALLIHLGYLAYDEPRGEAFIPNEELAYLPKAGSPLPALLIELKWNRPAHAAIEQVKRRDYPAVLRSWAGAVVLVGVSYDERTGKHEAVIEKLDK